MPICEADPWRLQYFEHADLSAGRRTSRPRTATPGFGIPSIAGSTTRSRSRAARGSTPRRMASCRRAFRCSPSRSPTSRAWGSAAASCRPPPTTRQALTAGHMWMALLEGRHVSSDVAVVEGEPRWWRHVTGAPSGEGTFDHWTVHAARDAGHREPIAAPGSAEHLAPLHRHPQYRDDRRPHDRGASAHERSVARSLRRRLGRCGGAALSRAPMGLRRRRPRATA